MDLFFFTILTFLLESEKFRFLNTQKTMNGILKLFFLCPVPEDQKPMNEYISLKENEWQKWIPFWKKRTLI